MSPEMPGPSGRTPPIVRAATPDDLDHIAALHAASWRATYRGILTDAFLDGPIEAERRATWRLKTADFAPFWPILLVAADESTDGRADDDEPERAPQAQATATAPGAPLRTATHEDSSRPSAPRGIVGFICVWPNQDAEWGTCIDNLHIAPARKGEGIGRRLLAEAMTIVERLAEARDRPVYLTVFEANQPARAVYERLGGRSADRIPGDQRDGNNVAMIRYVWNRPAALRAR